MAERLRWKLWGWVSKLPNVCPANLHSIIIWHTRRGPLIDSMCRSDAARNGVCWCGKLRDESLAVGGQYQEEAPK